ncbi:hypothetical protein M1L60_33910 [Actinoplanes sp. TRM 88003]|uniref:Uncharacterized protein n=1 Tax=Paractinoplanes aksuensis TaxID=2939490 RepID=A0ABT1DXI1_9ACTN|nr:hypothetical protein [Actinoplanes aksuensis]MCO8275592.1 hypothetical protein [Actinoplanes aksuensis]
MPLLLIALFVENRSQVPEVRSRLARRVIRLQDRVIAVMGLIAFFLSMFVLIGAVEVSGLTDGVVVAALGAAFGLLLGTIWRRLATPAEKAGEQPVPARSEDPV